MSVTEGSWRRTFALTAAILFVFSWIFPVGAGLARNTDIFPRWWGPVDVTLALVLAISAFGIQTLARGKVDKKAERTTYRIYRSSLHALLFVGALVMLAGNRIKWANCTTGFLWRTWLFLYILPRWLAVAGRPEIADPMRNPATKLTISSRVVGNFFFMAGAPQAHTKPGNHRNQSARTWFTNVPPTGY